MIKQNQTVYHALKRLHSNSGDLADAEIILLYILKLETTINNVLVNIGDVGEWEQGDMVVQIAKGIERDIK